MGPGAYNIDSGFKKTLKKLPSWKFGSAKRGYSLNNKNPGPGTYSSTGHPTRAVPKYTFGKRLNSADQKKYQTPGPGTYEMKSELGRLGYTMRPKTGVTDLRPGSQPVGPGSYNIPETIDKPKVRCVFGKSSRFILKNSNTNVGPGSYNLPSTKSNIAYSMRPKTGLKDPRNGNPGPGHYNPNVNLVNPKNPGSIFGKDKRDRENANVRAMKNIGPGSYNPELRNKGPIYSFGKSKRSGLNGKQTNPGPGHYNLKSFLEMYPAYATWKIN